MSRNKLSHSSVFLYNQCSLCYRLKYIDRIYPKKTKSAFVFGHALDCAFNSLLKERDLEKAKRIFLYRMRHVIINDKRVDIYNSDLVTYTKNDFHLELLTHFDGLKHPNPSWHSLCLKGLLIVEAYYKEVLPKIKDVISIQKRVTLDNEDGDKISGLLDSVVVWEDSRTYLIDNKSSTVKYEENSAKESDQLVLYYYIEKDNVKLDGVGFIVLDKNINMNKKKTCKNCGTVNESSHRTCPELIPTGEYGRSNCMIHKRCDGDFDVTFNPTVEIDYVFNQVDEKDEERVLDLFDKTNYNITNRIFETEHNPVFSRFGPCDYWRYYPGSPDFFIKEKRNA